MAVVTKVDGTIPTLGITTKEEVGVVTRVAAAAVVMGAVVMAAGAGVTKTLAIIASRPTAEAPLGTNSTVVTTVPRPTTWTRVAAAAAATAAVVAAAVVTTVAARAEGGVSK